MVTTSDGGGRGRTQPESWCQDRWDTFGGADPPSGALATNERVRARARKAQVSRGFSDGDSFGPSPRILLLRTPPLIFVTAEPISMVTCSGDVRGIGTSFGESLSKLNALRREIVRKQEWVVGLGSDRRSHQTPDRRDDRSPSKGFSSRGHSTPASITGLFPPRTPPSLC